MCTGTKKQELPAASVLPVGAQRFVFDGQIVTQNLSEAYGIRLFCVSVCLGASFDRSSTSCLDGYLHFIDSLLMVRVSLEEIYLYE